MKISFKKLEYGLLVESTKIENASLPYKTVISEWVQNGPITKNIVLPVTMLFFF